MVKKYKSLNSLTQLTKDIDKLNIKSKSKKELELQKKRKRQKDALLNLQHYDPFQLKYGRSLNLNVSKKLQKKMIRQDFEKEKEKKKKKKIKKSKSQVKLVKKAGKAFVKKRDIFNVNY